MKSLVTQVLDIYYYGIRRRINIHFLDWDRHHAKCCWMGLDSGHTGQEHGNLG